MTRRLLAGAALLCAAAACLAQKYPARPVSVLAPFGAQSSSTTALRLVTTRMAEGLGQPVIVENRTGAGGMIANAQVAKAPADGYTLLLVTGSFTNQVAMMKSLPYNVLRDFQPLSTITSYPFVLLVNDDSPFRSLGELLAHVRANPGKLNYGSSGIGSGQHLAGELFDATAGTRMVHIPFRTSPIFELAGGHVELTFDAAISAYPMLRGGKLRALAVTSTEPWSSVPSLPAMASLLPGYDISTFLGIVGPAGMPQEAVQRLNQEIRRVLAAPDVRKGFAELGAEPRASSPEEMHRMIEAEIARWTRLVDSRNIEKQ